MGRLLNAKRFTLATAMLVVAVLGLLPLCVMLLRSVSNSNGSLGFENYAHTLWRSRPWSLLFNSFVLAGTSTLVAGLMGIPLALVAVKTTVPFRRLIVAIFCLPLLFPPYVLANGWFHILGRQGLLSRWIGESGGAATSSWFFAMPGGVLVLATAFLPVVLLLSIAAISGVNPQMEDAARLHCGWTMVLKSITLPLGRPGIVLSVVLTFLLALGELAAPSFLRISVFPVESFTQFSAFYDVGAATATSVPLGLIAFLLLIASRKWMGSGEYHFRWVISGTNQLTPGSMDRWKAAGLLAVAAMVVILPCGALLMNGLSFGAITEAWYRAGDSMAWSLVYSALAATGITLLGFFLGYASQRRSIEGSGFISMATLILFALPGTLIGIGLVTTWNRPLFAWLYASPAALLTGLMMQYIAIGERGMASSLTQLSPSLEEAAQIADAGWFRRVGTILVPLLRPSMLAVWMLAFILCLRDTSLPLLLSPPGQDTLTARTLTLMANGSQELISALCLFSMALPIVPLMIGFVLLRGARRS